jgi:4-hydroxy-tetrahydrodipicolinate synthase
MPLVNFEAQAGVGLAVRKAGLAERGIFTSGAVRPPAPRMPPALLPILRAHAAAVHEKGAI